MKQQIRLGSKVTWLCSPRTGKPFQAIGIVTGFGTRNAGKKMQKAVLLSVDRKSKYYKTKKKLSTSVLLVNVKLA